MKRKVYQGDENIVVYGKISEAICKISSDKEVMEKFKDETMTAIAEIMQKYKNEVTTILTLSVDGDVAFENVGVYFLKLFTEYYTKFNEMTEDNFFSESVTKSE